MSGVQDGSVLEANASGAREPMLSQDVSVAPGPTRPPLSARCRCETCIDQLYTLGPQGCPQCGRILRKTNYIHQTFEDLHVEKEVGIRKRLNAIFNKERRDFADEKAYNDYLEMVEDISRSHKLSLLVCF